MTGALRHPLAPAVAALTAALATTAGALATGASVAEASWAALLFALLASLAWIDAATETVPDLLTLALVASGVAHAASAGAALLPVAGTAALLLLAGVLHGRITGDRGWVGSGDFFLLAGIVAWFGPLATLDVLALASVALILHGILARRATVVVAPSLAAAAALVWMEGTLL